MNVLILTPDRVGSTLLQRLITIYMLRRDFGRPVINLHELTNGIIKYYNPTLNQEVLGKDQTLDIGYLQSLPEILDLLKSVDHYKTSRLAHYHLVRRNDNLSDQLSFYEYLNRNFYIISCRRQNLLEHALSWGISSFSKRLNVYTTAEKIDCFQDVYKNGIHIEHTSFIKYLNDYVKYINWSDTYFNVQSYFDYDTHMSEIEKYILNLDFMNGHENNTWQDMFGQSFSNWNACHRMLPNLLLHDRSTVAGTKTIPVNRNEISMESYNLLRGEDWPESWRDPGTAVMPHIQEEIHTRFDVKSVPVTDSEYNFLSSNLSVYQETSMQIENLTKLGFLVTGVPVKLQTLHEKRQVVKNFDQTVEWYNAWVEKTGQGEPYTDTQINQGIQTENSHWDSVLKLIK